MKKLPKHLGGHGNFTHLDEGVLNHLINKYHIKSMLDIGCGPGGMVDLAISKGIDAVGIDGDFTIPRTCPVIIHDYTEGPVKHPRKYDLGWSVEFLEHIRPNSIKNFMLSFQVCERVVITFSNNAKPKKHVNPRPLEYWIPIFKKYGFKYSERISNKLKKSSTMEREFFRNSGSYFYNIKYSKR